MDADLYLVVGSIILAFAIPAIISAFSENRAPRAAAILVMVGGGLVALAVSQRPGGYDFEDVPQAFVNVIGRLLN